MAPGWSKLSSEEIRLAKMWYPDDGYTPLEIAELFHREKTTLTRLLCLEMMREQGARPCAFTEEEIDKIVGKLEAKIIKANKNISRMHTYRFAIALQSC